MKPIKKIQPKASQDIDFDILAQRIKANKVDRIEVESPPQAQDTIPKKQKPEKTGKIAIQKKELKKPGRKKTNFETMHRFAIDLPEWLFEQIRQDATINFSTVRGQILKVLLQHYKQ